MAPVSAEDVSKVFVKVADALVGDFDLVEFLQMVTAQSSELASARAAGLLLAGPQKRLQLMAASDERAEMLELFQVQAREGPCQDCFSTGEPVVNVDLAAATATDRWPLFAPRAVAAGYRSVHAFPLRVGDHIIGALNLFGTGVGDMAPEDVRVIQAVADVATVGLLQARSLRDSELLIEQLQGALNTRIVMEQAKGVLAQVHHSTPDEAFELMRKHCRARNLRLGEVAFAVVDDPTSVPELTTPDH
jgi:GAF domain-containing protein